MGADPARLGLRTIKTFKWCKMKKALLIIIVGFIVLNGNIYAAGETSHSKDDSVVNKENKTDTNKKDVVVKYGCEYVRFNSTFDSYVYVHKGNCKFCEEKRKAEQEKTDKLLQELINAVKEKK